MGVGAYRDNNGKPYVFPVVRKAEKMICEDMSLDKEYAPIDGDADFCRGSRGALFGWDHKDVTSGRVASAQTLSGTGALNVLGTFLKQFRSVPIYISNPTWGNHNQVFASVGLTVHQYRYFDAKTKGLDINGMLEDLAKAQSGSVVLLHTCAHNPTGVDPSKEQWAQIADVCAKN